MKNLFCALATLLPMLAADLKIEPSARLQATVDAAVTQTLAVFAGENLKPDDLAATVLDLRDPARLESGSYRGAVSIYPASVIKLFYLEAAHRWLEDGKLRDTAELRRALRDMIVDSSNEATHYALDLLTGTTSGPELPEAEMRDWAFKRNAVNRYFEGRGYTGINANQKPWCEGPYGREAVFVGADRSNRNMLTTEATARLLAEIALGRAVSAERSAQMMALLRRGPAAAPNDPPNDFNSQTRGFTGSALPPSAKLWSKAGWTSQTRHDAACVELPGGRRVILALFTERHAPSEKILPVLARAILENLPPP